MDDFAVWVVYKNPSDHPGRWVVREQRAARGVVTVSVSYWVGDSLEAARGAIPPGMFCQPRLDNDDPAVYECWF